jgi:hypothetical protein
MALRDAGPYELFAVQGPLALTIRVTKDASSCASLCGLFLDPLPILPPIPPTLRTQAPASLTDAVAFYEQVREAWDRNPLAVLRQREPLERFLDDWEERAARQKELGECGLTYWLLWQSSQTLPADVERQVHYEQQYHRLHP